MKGIYTLLALALLGLPSALSQENLLDDTDVPNGCFPILAPNADTGGLSLSLSHWWCSPDSERGFLGFTYSMESCQSLDTLRADFARMRNNYKARYVRMHSWCEFDVNYLRNFIDAAYSVGLGVYAAVPFKDVQCDWWAQRRDLLLAVITGNPLAPYVIRSLDVGVEPVPDSILNADNLQVEIHNVKNLIVPYEIQVATPKMQCGDPAQADPQLQKALDAEDVVHLPQLPFLDTDARSGGDAGPFITSSTACFVARTKGARKVIFTQAGWPTNTNTGTSKSPNAVASVDSAKAFANLLDKSCESFKSSGPQGGVGWFWHIWSDAMVDGWGLIDRNGNPKWDFAPRTDC